jgi:hypothetical protein
MQPWKWADAAGGGLAAHCPLDPLISPSSAAPCCSAAPNPPPPALILPNDRKYDGDALWLPNTTRPEWLDGTLPGDRGFDPLGLSRPSDFVQIGVDENDQNAAKNSKGDVEGRAAAIADIVDTDSSLSPYSEVFGLQRFRETELIHGRWAMLGVLGVLIAEGVTGQNWCVRLGSFEGGGWWEGRGRGVCSGRGSTVLMHAPFMHAAPCDDGALYAIPVTSLCIGLTPNPSLPPLHNQQDRGRQG